MKKIIMLGLIGWAVGGLQLLAQNEPDGLGPVVFGGAGDFVTNTVDSLSLSFTMGEVFTLTSITRNERLILTQGFQQPEQQELVGIFVPPPLTVDCDVYPNPTPRELYLRLRGKERTTLYAAIYDLAGKRTPVPEQKLGFIGSLTTVFDLSTLPEGTYLLRLYDESRNLASSLKIQKAHP